MASMVRNWSEVVAMYAVNKIEMKLAVVVS